MASLLLASCTKDPAPELVLEKPVEKKVIYQVYAAKDYSPAIFDKVQTMVTLTVGAVANKTGAFTKIWDTTINGHIRTFPQFGQKIQIEKTFTLIESVEKLQVAKSVRFDDNGQIQQSASFEPIPTGTNIFLMGVGL